MSVPRPRSRAHADPPEPLGSLSRGDDLLSPGGAACRSCGGVSLTRLRMVLGDGTPVVFVSCHECEDRSWLTLDGMGTVLSRQDVLGRSAKR
jgi:hypothetical protein